MSVLDTIFTPRLQSMQTAMSLATRRESLLTANLANVNVPGYKRKDISFDLTLQETMEGTQAAVGARQRQMLDQQAQAASDETSMRLDGNNVDLEKETMSVAETQMRYDALSLMTSDYFSGLKSVIHEGK